MSPRPRLATDEEILDATARAVSRLGPHRLTLAEVARDAGLSAATLVQRFGSKRGLLLAFARQAGEVSRVELAAARAAHESPLDALVAVSLSQTNNMDSPEALSNHLAFMQMDLNDPEFRALARNGAKLIHGELHSLLDAAVDAGELTDCDTASLARAVQAVFRGSILLWAIYRTGTARKWLRRDLETVLLPYRRKRKNR